MKPISQYHILVEEANPFHCLTPFRIVQLLSCSCVVRASGSLNGANCYKSAGLDLGIDGNSGGKIHVTRRRFHT